MLHSFARDFSHRGCNVCRDKGEDVARAPALTLDSNPNGTADATAAATAVTAAPASASEPAADSAADQYACLAYMHSECPLNRRELGRASWAYLHTLAAYYPDKPTKAQQDDMRQYITAYARWYPCGYCADRTSDEMVRKPPRVESQQAFSYWMCEIHNEVNDRMGKEIFDCDKVTTRWKTGPADGSCQ